MGEAGKFKFANVSAFIPVSTNIACIGVFASSNSSILVISSRYHGRIKAIVIEHMGYEPIHKT